MSKEGNRRWRLAHPEEAREATRRGRARKRGEDVPLRKPGPPKGTPQKATEDIGMEALHKRVYAVRGAPVECVFGCVPDRPCKISFYAWANMTGDYGNIWNYAPMCVRCHTRFDDAVWSVEFPDRPPRRASTKLTVNDVREIRALVASGLSRAATARRFGVTTSNVDRIIARKTWRHI